MMSNDEYDAAVKDAARKALKDGLTGTALDSFADEAASRACEGQDVCSVQMARDILDFHLRLAARQRERAEGEPVLFRKYPDGEVIALFPAKPGPMQVLDMKAYSQQDGSFDMDLAAWRDSTIPATEEDAAALRAELEAKGIKLRVIGEDEITEEMDDVRRSRNSFVAEDEGSGSAMGLGLALLLIAGVLVGTRMARRPRST